MPTYRAGDTKTASLTIHNPNPVVLPVTVFINVGGSPTAPQSGTIGANASIDFSFNVTMPSGAGTYNVTVPVQYNGSTMVHTAGSVQVYQLLSPSVSFDWSGADTGSDYSGYYSGYDIEE